MAKLPEKFLAYRGESLIRPRLLDMNQGGAIVRQISTGPFGFGPQPEQVHKYSQTQVQYHNRFTRHELGMLMPHIYNMVSRYPYSRWPVTSAAR